MKARRTLHERLSTRRALIGLLQTHPDPALTEMAGMCGYDFVILDDEHGTFSGNDHLQAFQAIGPTDIAAFVRLRRQDPQDIGRYLDMGADGIVVPNVTSAEQATALVCAMDYPPAGTRGFGATVHRATRYGIDLAAHLASPRGGASLVVLIESAIGVANVDEILSIDGVDGAFIGPSDLTASLGCAGDFANPLYAEAVRRIEQAASARGKLIGTGAHPGYPIEALVARGHRLLLIGADMPLIREAMSAQVAKANACLSAD